MYTVLSFNSTNSIYAKYDVLSLKSMWQGQVELIVYWSITEFDMSIGFEYKPIGA